MVVFLKISFFYFLKFDNKSTFDKDFIEKIVVKKLEKLRNENGRSKNEITIQIRVQVRIVSA